MLINKAIGYLNTGNGELATLKNRKKVNVGNIGDETVSLNLSFPPFLYFNYLKDIRGIPFTSREIDITACILSGRSAKKIASFLSISPRTVENYIRNIMIKIGCGSQEQIIDFVEKSGKFTLVKKHYSALLIQAIFEKELKKSLLSLTDTEKISSPSCTIICDKKNQDEMVFICQLEKYLKLVGIEVEIDDRQEYTSTINFNDSAILKHNHYIIYTLPIESLDQSRTTEVPNKGEIKGELPNFIKLADENENSVIFLSFDKTTLVTHLSLKPFQFEYLAFKEEEDYYFLIFELLKKLLPHINFDKNIIEFRLQYETFFDPISNKRELEKENIKSFSTKGSDVVKIFKKGKGYILISSIATIFICVSVWVFNKASEHKPTNKETSVSNFRLKDFLKTENTPQTIKAKSDILTVWNLPRHDNKFIGRKDLLNKIADDLHLTSSQGGTSKATVTICAGLGGVGKTQLALQYLYHSPYPYTLKAWFPAENQEQLKQKMVEFAKQLGFFKVDASFEEEIPIDIVINYIKQWLSQHPGWLLIYDNVGSYNEIKSFLPEEGGHVILTTRNRHWPSNFSVLSVDVMHEEEAVDLVKSLIHRDGKFDEENAIRKLVRVLGFLPLTLAQAGTYIQNKAIAVTDYLTLYEQYEQKMLSNISMPEGADHTPTSITWNVTLEAIEREMEEKKQTSIVKTLLTACSYLHSDNIHRIVLLEWLKKSHPELKEPELVLDESLALLSKYSLINLAQDNISVHRLVQTVLRQQHSSNPTVPGKKCTALNQSWFEKLFEALDKIFWHGPANYEQREQKLFPHLSSLIEHYKKIWPDLKTISYAHALCNVGWVYQYHFHDLSLAKSHLEQSLYILENHNDEIERVSKILNSLGVVYRELGQPYKAIEFIEQALKIKKQLHGEEHMEIAISLNSLGIAYGDLGMIEQAKSSLEKSLMIKEKINGINHISIANTLTNLGILYQEQKNLKHAKYLLERALAIQSCKVPNYDDIYIGKTLTYLGSTYLELGNPTLAKSLLERALIIRENNLGKDHINVAVTLDNLGIAYNVLGETSKAKIVLDRALSIKSSYKKSMHQLKN